MEDTLVVYKKYIESLTLSEKQAIEYYTHSCTIANNLIRTGKKLVGNDASYYNEILKIFKNAPKVKSPLFVYRGVVMSSLHDCKEYSGFISTTVNKNIVEDFSGLECCKFKICIPPGDYSVLPIWSISEYPNEDEVLLPPGSIQIIGMSDDYYDCVYIHNAAVTTFDVNTGNTGNVFMTDDEWVLKLQDDITDEMIIYASELYYDTLDYKDFGDYYEDFGDWHKSFIQSTISKLDYWNDIPTEALYEYLDSVIPMKRPQKYLLNKKKY
jgi:hypothetical protein